MGTRNKADSRRSVNLVFVTTFPKDCKIRRELVTVDAMVRAHWPEFWQSSEAHFVRFCAKYLLPLGGTNTHKPLSSYDRESEQKSYLILIMRSFIQRRLEIWTNAKEAPSYKAAYIRHET